MLGIGALGQYALGQFPGGVVPPPPLPPAEVEAGGAGAIAKGGGRHKGGAHHSGFSNTWLQDEARRKKRKEPKSEDKQLDLDALAAKLRELPSPEIPRTEPDAISLQSILQEQSNIAARIESLERSANEAAAQFLEDEETALLLLAMM